MKTLVILILVWVISLAIIIILAAKAEVYEQQPDGSWRKVPKHRIGKLTYKNNKYLQKHEQLTETADCR